MSTDDITRLNRRRFLGASVAATVSVGGLAACGSQSPAQAAAGPSTDGRLADVVFEAFKTHRVVGIGETHGLQNHHDVLDLLLTDPRVPDVIDDIVIEFGNALYQDTIDRFIAGRPVDNVELRKVWRNTTQSPLMTFDEPVYEQFFRTVRAVNWTRPPEKQIRVLAGDPPIDWSKITNGTELLRFAGSRDTHTASVVEHEVLARGHRALLCYGWWHLLHTNGIARLLQQHAGERMYTIADLVPLAGDPGGVATRLSRYPRDTVIPTAGTWLGSLDAGLLPASLQRTPLGPPMNPWCGTKFGSLIDAGIYEAQPADLTATWPNPAIYLDPTYWAELQRRNALEGKVIDLDTYRQEQPARFQLQQLPHSQKCSAGKA
jgi:hypothetical protein